MLLGCIKKRTPPFLRVNSRKGEFNIISFLTESHQLLVSKRNSEVTLLASWVNTLNVENWILTGWCFLNDILQIVNALHHVFICIFKKTPLRKSTLESECIKGTEGHPPKAIRRCHEKWQERCERVMENKRKYSKNGWALHWCPMNKEVEWKSITHSLMEQGITHKNIRKSR